MKLTIISQDRKSYVSCETANPEVTKHLTCTLRPICLAHEISHIKLGHITMAGLTQRNDSFSSLLLQELACWQYVFALNKWDIEDMQFAFSCLDNTIQELGVTYKVLKIYREFKDEYLPNS